MNYLMSEQVEELTKLFDNYPANVLRMIYNADSVEVFTDWNKNACLTNISIIFMYDTDKIEVEDRFLHAHKFTNIFKAVEFFEDELDKLNEANETIEEGEN